MSRALAKAGIADAEMRPAAGEYRLLGTRGAIGPKSALFVGTVDLYEISYAELRDFARASLEAIAKAAHEDRTVGFTLHGANFGLDEGQAFLSLLTGLDYTLAQIPPLQRSLRAASTCPPSLPLDLAVANLPPPRS